MTVLTILGRVSRATYSGLGTRILRSIGDGCIALPILIGLCMLATGRLPPQFLQALADSIGADRSIEGADDVLLLLGFGGFVLTALIQAIYLAGMSFLCRTAHSAWTAARAPTGTRREEAGNV